MLKTFQKLLFEMMEISISNDLLLFELIDGELQRRRRQNLPKTPNNGAR